MMTLRKRRVLLATPVKGGLSVDYQRSLLPVVMRRVPDVEFEARFYSGGAVNFARNDAEADAVAGNFDDVIMIDDDVAYTPDHIDRILSHDLDVVFGVYCKRKPGKPFWLFKPLPDTKPDANNLLECSAGATGFMRIRVSALKTMRAKYPEREFAAQEDSNGPVKVMFELFPMGVVGPRTAEARLAEVKAILSKFPRVENRRAMIPAGLLDDLRDAADGQRGVGSIRGEDYFFCRLARQAGFKVYADLGLGVIGHLGITRFPVGPDQVGYVPGEPFVMPPAQEDLYP